MMRKLLLGVAASVLMTSSALAVDLATPSYATGTNWDGFYAGIYGSYFDGPADFALGGIMGVNVEVDTDIIIGAEIQAGYYPSGGWYDLLAFGRLGYAISDDVLVFGMVGGGSGASTGVWAAGGGLEFMVMPNMSLRGEAQALGSWTGGGPWFRAAGSALWHFN